MSSNIRNWEPARKHPPRTSSRWPTPGIFVNVEFGVSLAPDHRTHTASMKYTSSRMEERLHEERIRQQYEQGMYHGQHPAILLPAQGNYPEHQSRHRQQSTAHVQQQERQRRLGVRPREQHERGTSAPPTVMTDRSQPISPISPMSPIGSLRHTSSIPLERTNQTLPPTPSQFRLGEADLPWSVPPWYRPQEPEFASPTPLRAETEPRRLDDPQRVRDLEALHQAMMTVDSLNNDGWEPWTWDSVGDMPRGPRSIGWAVSSNDAPHRGPISAPLSPLSPDGPPPYVVSQWEQAFIQSHSRPRTSSS